MGCCQSHLLSQLQTSNQNYLENHSAGEPTQYSKEFIHALLSGIQDHHRKNKKERIKNHPTPLSKAHFNDYLQDVIKDLNSQQVTMKEAISKLTDQLGAPIFNQDSVEEGIRSYMQDKRITLSEVTNWLRKKTEMVQKEGKNLAQKISQSSLKKEEKERCFEIYQVVVDDRLQTEKDFLLSVAYGIYVLILEFLWTDDLKIET